VCMSESMYESTSQLEIVHECLFMRECARANDRERASELVNEWVSAQRESWSWLVCYVGKFVRIGSFMWPVDRGVSDFPSSRYNTNNQLSVDKITDFRR